MFLKNANLGKAVLVSASIYIIAFMAVAWAPWDPSPNFTTVMDDFRRDQRIGYHIYQLLVIAFILLANAWWKPAYSGKSVSFAMLLLVIPQWILERYGMENLFSLPWSVLQMACTAVLAYLILDAKERRQPQVPV